MQQDPGLGVSFEHTEFNTLQLTFSDSTAHCSVDGFVSQLLINPTFARILSTNIENSWFVEGNEDFFHCDHVFQHDWARGKSLFQSQNFTEYTLLQNKRMRCGVLSSPTPTNPTILKNVLYRSIDTRPNL